MNKRTVAIIGVGPRGLAALEQLYISQEQASTNTKITTILFETSEYPGAGQIWAPDQVNTNLTNVHERLLCENLKGRPAVNLEWLQIPSFPKYAGWLEENKTKGVDTDVDFFPPRAKLGRYLRERFLSIKNALEAQDLLKIYEEIAVKIETASENVTIHTQNNQYAADEVLLTIGHQPTENSKQLQKWEEHAEQYEGLMLYKKPYPVDALKTDSITPKTTIALRGFGLSMVDQVRALTLGYDGKFVDKNDLEFTYIPSGKEPEQLVVFSLDGLPPAPKPVDAEVDGWFELSTEDYEAFCAVLENARDNPEDIQDASFLIKGIASATASIFLRLDKRAYAHEFDRSELYKIIEKLIRNPDLDHELILSQKLSPVNMMNSFLRMAVGKEKISLDYCLGQVWRIALDVLYKEYYNLGLSDKAMTDVVKYIAASKRYSYGPPVESLKQLLALVDAGKLTFELANDPKITLSPQGWNLKQNGMERTAQVMVNAVIDAPQLVKVNSDLIKNLLLYYKIDPVDYSLGLHTREDGRILKETEVVDERICLMGRLAKGSIFGVDNLVECFGDPATKWANGVTTRIN
ncbi:MAG: FAD/NAD(P)-binding protein [Leeuwenhoekiella sp.]